MKRNSDYRKNLKYIYIFFFNLKFLKKIEFFKESQIFTKILNKFLFI